MRFLPTISHLGVAMLLLSTAAAANAGVLFSQDFESGLGASESTSGAFVINNTGGGNNGTQMMGHATTYGNNEYSYYQISGLTLTGSNLRMQFDYAGSFESHFDRFNVLIGTTISPPGGLATPTLGSNMQFINLGDNHQPSLGQFAYDTSTSSGGAFGLAEFDLSAFVGQTVDIRFQFGSDASVVAGGFNMDNLNITNNSTVPEPGSLALAALGLTGLCFGRRRKA